MIERVFAITSKRFKWRLSTILTETELEALLAAPDRATWTGRRDHALFALARTTPVHSTPGRYLPPDTLMAFLEAL